MTANNKVHFCDCCSNMGHFLYGVERVKRFVNIQSKALSFLYAFAESADCALLSSFCDDSRYKNTCEHPLALHRYRAYARGGGVTLPLEFHVTKTLLPALRRLIVFAYKFVDLMQIPRNEFACTFQGALKMGQKVIIIFWWESGLSSASRNHITTFCSPFVHYAVRCLTRKKENWKFAGVLYTAKKRKFSCVLYVHYQFFCSSARFDLANRDVLQPVQPHTFYARLLIFDETLAQPGFAVVIALTKWWVCFTPQF